MNGVSFAHLYLVKARLLFALQGHRSSVTNERHRQNEVGREQGKKPEAVTPAMLSIQSEDTSLTVQAPKLKPM